MTLSWKPTIVILAVCGAAIGAVLWLEKGEEEAGAVPTYRFDAVVRIRVEAPRDGASWTASQEGQGEGTIWAVTEPVQEPARPDVMAAIVQALNALSPHDRAPVETTPENLRAFGLTEDRALRVVTVTVRDEEGTVDHRYLIGDQDPALRRYYARIVGNDADVFWLTDTGFFTFGTAAPVDPHVFGPMDLTITRAIEAENVLPTGPGQEPFHERYRAHLAIEPGGGWIVDEPERLRGDRLDNTELSTLLMAVRDIQAAPTEGRDGVDFRRGETQEAILAEYGLDAPGKRLSVMLGETAVEFRLSERPVEGHPDAPERFAWSSRYPLRVARISAEDFARLPERVDALRTKRIYAWNPQEVASLRIEILRADGTAERALEVRHNPRPEPGTEGPAAPEWTIAEPTAGTLDPAAIGPVLGALQPEEVAEFAPEVGEHLELCGLDHPRIRLTVGFADPSRANEPVVHTYEFGKTGAEGSEIYYGRRLAAPGIFRVRWEHFRFLYACDLLLRPPRVLTVDPPDAIDWIDCSGIWELGPVPRDFHWQIVRRDDLWDWGEPRLPRELDPEKIRTLIERLTALGAEAFMSWDPADAPKYGLDDVHRSATMRFRWTDRQGNAREAVIVFSSAEAPGRYATIEGAPGMEGLTWQCAEALWATACDEREGVWKGVGPPRPPDHH